MTISYVKTNLDPTAQCVDCNNAFTSHNPALAHEERDPIHVGCLEKKIVDHKVGSTDDAILKCGACFAEVSDILGIPVEKPLPNREYAKSLAEKVVANGTEKKSQPIGRFPLKTALAALFVFGAGVCAWFNRSALVNSYLSSVEKREGADAALKLAENCYAASNSLSTPCGNWLENHGTQVQDLSMVENWIHKVADPDPATKSFYSKLASQYIKTKSDYQNFLEIFKYPDVFLNDESLPFFLDHYSQELANQFPVDEKNVLKAIEMGLGKEDFSMPWKAFALLKKLPIEISRDLAFRILQGEFPCMFTEAVIYLTDQKISGINEIAYKTVEKGISESNSDYFVHLRYWIEEGQETEFAVRMIAAPKISSKDENFYLYYLPAVDLVRRNVEAAYAPALALIEEGLDLDPSSLKTDSQFAPSLAQDSFFDLLTELNRRNLGYAAAETVLISGMNTKDPVYFNRLISLGENLFEQNAIGTYPTLVKLVEKGVENEATRDRSLVLLQKLVSKGYGDRVAAKVIERRKIDPNKGYSDSYHFIRQLGRLAIELIKKNKQVDSAISFLKLASTYTEGPWKDASLENLKFGMASPNVQPILLAKMGSIIKELDLRY